MNAKENLQNDAKNLEGLETKLKNIAEKEGEETKLPKGITLATAVITAMAMTVCSDSDNEQNEPPDEEPEEHIENADVGPHLSTGTVFEEHGHAVGNFYGRYNHEKGYYEFKVVMALSEELWENLERNSQRGTALLQIRFVRLGFVPAFNTMNRNWEHNPAEQVYNGREGTPAEGHTIKVQFNHHTNNMTFLGTVGSLPHEGFDGLRCDISAADNYNFRDGGWIHLGTIPGGPSGNTSVSSSMPEEFRDMPKVERRERRIDRKSM